MDDDPEIIETLQTAIGYLLPDVRVVCARSGEEGLALLRKQAVDVIITDYKMPGMNGLDFVRQARAHAPKAAAVLISAFRNSMGDNEARDAHVVAFFEKPFELEDLVAEVARHLPKRR